jgi:hypothetical protein
MTVVNLQRQLLLVLVPVLNPTTGQVSVPAGTPVITIPLPTKFVKIVT